MAQYSVTKASGTAAVDWHDLKASSEILDGLTGEFVVRADAASRVAIGVVDPGTSTTAGVPLAADGSAVKLVLSSAAAQQTIWVQTPADQSDVGFEVDTAGASDALVIVA